MFVKELMQKDLVTVSPKTSLAEAARTMRIRSVGSLLVLDGDRLVGIVTDRDIAMAVAADGREARKTRVREVMTSEPVAAAPADDIEIAMRTMNRVHARRLPILDAGKLVGILSTSDIASGMKNQLDHFMGLEEIHLKH